MSDHRIKHSETINGTTLEVYDNEYDFFICVGGICTYLYSDLTIHFNCSPDSLGRYKNFKDAVETLELYRKKEEMEEIKTHYVIIRKNVNTILWKSQTLEQAEVKALEFAKQDIGDQFIIFKAVKKVECLESPIKVTEYV